MHWYARTYGSRLPARRIASHVMPSRWPPPITTLQQKIKNRLRNLKILKETYLLYRPSLRTNSALKTSSDPHLLAPQDHLRKGHIDEMVGNSPSGRPRPASCVTSQAAVLPYVSTQKVDLCHFRRPDLAHRNWPGGTGILYLLKGSVALDLINELKMNSVYICELLNLSDNGFDKWNKVI